ncbi:cytochrome bc1 complex diheme cytochrome c subunit [Microlunatus parietis]|uniref:Cytochrome bc1 complex cytochrome c subunit n=1 Tax=Microlunatus parietis TaxID=682979 RepID=A0A7Y9IEJ6_9ACTN|nr:cytochrome c [Microlunatus parietis]NYE74764.1 ubiquinol-cytochrome c reductase cytochrome c subunit [Microlunatus parietis]
MRFLSARRRHPAAKVLMLLFALVVVGGIYSVVSPADQVAADTGKSQQIAEGKALFAVGCASCHGLQGEGQVSGTIQGPPLIGVGAAAVDFQVGTGRMPMAQPGQQAPRKKNLYTDEEIAALAAYVASLGPGPDIPAEEDYNPEGLSDEDLARGGELFRTNCSACHNFAGSGGALPNGKYAPTLEGVSNRHLYEAMQTGPQQMPVFPDRALTPEEKRQIIGYLNHLNSQPNAGGFTLGGLGPVSEGFWAWVVGLGVLIAFTVWITAKGARAK